MSRRRVLVLCYFFPPLAGGGVHRVLSFTRALPDFGWDCSVVCAGAEDYWVSDDSLLARVREGTDVLRVSGGSALSAWLRLRRGDRGRRPGAAFAGLRAASDWWLFPDSYAGWSDRAARAARQRLARGDIDAVLSSSPPDSVHRAALSLRSHSRVPWVADFRDPWVGLHLRTPPTAWHRERHARAEREVLEGADLVLAASRTHADAITAMPGPSARRVVHLPNGFEPAEPEAAPQASDGARDTFEIVWTGTLSQMPDAEVFFEALHELLARRPEARRRLRARIAGPFDSEYQDRAVALGLTGIVEFQGPRAHHASRAAQRAADLLVLWKPRYYPTMVPGKLYEYLDAGRPLLALLPPGDEAAALVERGGGTCVAPGDRTGLAAAIEQHYLRWRAGERTPSVRPAWLDAYARPALAARLAGELDQLVGART